MGIESAPWYALERGEGRPLVLLHGIGMAHSAWAPVMDRLASERRAIAFDIPGFGRSPALPAEIRPTQQVLAQALASELDRRGLEQPVDIAGNSLGGQIGLELAALGRARSVVALSPSGLWVGGAPLYPRAALRLTRWVTLYGGAALRHGLRSRAGRAVIMRVPVSAHGSRISPAVALEAARDFASGPAFDAIVRAGQIGFRSGQRIHVPLTVGFGERDVLLPSGGTRRRDLLPGHTRWIELPDCGHVPMWDNPPLVAEAILEGTSG